MHCSIGELLADASAEHETQAEPLLDKQEVRFFNAFRRRHSPQLNELAAETGFVSREEC
jgi:hypothetical protein